MTICLSCRRDIEDGNSCGRQPVVGFNQRWERVTFGNEVDFTEEMKTCPGCYVSTSSYHHVYCAFEECPKCQGKIDNCGCFYTKEK